MSILHPAAHRLDDQTGEYGPSDVATSGGDIGVQVPIFPVVWVSVLPHRMCFVPLIRRSNSQHAERTCRAAAQLKGIKNYHGGRKETIVRENVQAHCGWLTTSSNRRDWLFVQDLGDMSAQGVKFYERLNNLGALRAPPPDAPPPHAPPPHAPPAHRWHALQAQQPRCAPRAASRRAASARAACT